MVAGWLVGCCVFAWLLLGGWLLCDCSPVAMWLLGCYYVVAMWLLGGCYVVAWWLLDGY